MTEVDSMVSMAAAIERAKRGQISQIEIVGLIEGRKFLGERGLKFFCM